MNISENFSTSKVPPCCSPGDLGCRCLAGFFGETCVGAPGAPKKNRWFQSWDFRMLIKIILKSLMGLMGLGNVEKSNGIIMYHNRWLGNVVNLMGFSEYYTTHQHHKLQHFIVLKCPQHLKKLGKSTDLNSGWWFGTWILFYSVGNVIIPTDFHIFQRCRLNHQPDISYIYIYQYVIIPSYNHI